ncbi:MAG: hypothetical protein HDR72_00660 [Ruminococcaceae bacterium]|nr:hypothetical protein [Oscillospiraceae bacterium]
MTESVIKIVESSVKLLNSTLETLAVIRVEMDKLSSTLPEYETVMSLYGVGELCVHNLLPRSAMLDASVPRESRTEFT